MLGTLLASGPVRTWSVMLPQSVTGSWGLRIILGLPLPQQIAQDVANRLHPLKLGVRNVTVEFFFELHHKFDGIERIGAQVVDEGCLRRDLLGIDPKLLRDDPPQFFPLCR